MSTHPQARPGRASHRHAPEPRTARPRRRLAPAAPLLLSGLLACGALAACGGDAVTTPPPPPAAPNQPAAPSQSTPLRGVIEQRGLRIGIGTAVGQYFNRADAAGTQYMTVLAREFNVLTAENDMKFGPLRPNRATFRFGRADSMVAFARANGMKVRGHTLVWHQQLAPWLTGGTWTTAEARTLLEEHIAGVAGHFRGQIAAWDVVNEAIADDGSFRSTFWSDRVGRDYVDRAFRAARAADPGAELFYNDYGIEWPGAKTDSTYALVAGLKARGVPIDGIGFQMHLEVGRLPSTDALLQNFARFAALGLKIHITELDVRIRLPSTQQQLETQAQNYRTVFDVCLRTPACEMIVVWGLSDRDSWVPQTFPGQGEPLLFDAELRPKAAYRAVHDILSGR